MSHSALSPVPKIIYNNIIIIISLSPFHDSNIIIVIFRHACTEAVIVLNYVLAMS